MLIVYMTPPRIRRREPHVALFTIRQVGAAAKVLVVLLHRIGREVEEAVATARQEVAFAHLQEWRIRCDKLNIHKCSMQAYLLMM